MKNSENIREKILDQPSYWVEGINSFLYNAILDYMESNDMNRTKLSEHLGISKGRVSQILNDGEINFSIEKVIQIALKIDKFPIIDFIDKQEYLRDLNSSKDNITINYENDRYSEETYGKSNNKGKIIPLFSNNEFSKQLAL